MSAFDLESHYQSAICTLARKLGCLVFHPQNVKKSVAGFPDLTIVGKRGFIFREVKLQDGRVSPAQREWLDKFTAAGADADVWRPSDWPERVTAELRAIA